MYGGRAHSATKNAYRLRHSGAAHYIFTKKKKKKDVKRQGRWAHDKSMMVYSKLHLLIRALSRVPERVLRQGAFLAENPDLLAKIWVREFRSAGRPKDGRGLPLPSSVRGELAPPSDWNLPAKYVRPEVDCPADNESEGEGPVSESD